MGLLINVYRSHGPDCTNNGISAMASTLCLVNVDGPFDPSDRSPAAMLVAGRAPGTIRIVPAFYEDAKWRPHHAWTMMGGNYAATSDSRFSQACEVLLGDRFYGAVAIHDRIEN